MNPYHLNDTDLIVMRFTNIGFHEKTGTKRMSGYDSGCEKSNKVDIIAIGTYRSP